MKNAKRLLLFVSITSAITFNSCESERDETAGPDEVITPPKGTEGKVTDIDNNTYKTITIGTQIWMAENLKTSKYADGTDIPYVTDDTAWENLEDNDADKAYCFYENDEDSGYGVLYTYAAATNGDNSGNNVQGACPTGWHLPSDDDWNELENYLADNGYNYNNTTGGGRERIAKALSSQEGWPSSTSRGAIGNEPSLNNTSGFSALPGGFRSDFNGIDGTFYYAGINGFWWTSTQYDDYHAYNHYLFHDDKSVRRGVIQKSSGLSIRCVQD